MQQRSLRGRIMFSPFPRYFVALLTLSPLHFSTSTSSFVPFENELMIGDNENNPLLSDTEFGYHTALASSGRVLLVGAPNHPTTMPATSGAIFVFEIHENETDNNNNNNTEVSISWKRSNALYPEAGEGRLGTMFAVNPTGDILAVRHEDRVQLYTLTFEEDLGVPLLGNALAVYDCPGSISDSFLQLTSQYLVVGCEHFDQDRGKVEVYVPTFDYASWERMVVLYGESHGDRFGATAVLDDSVPSFSKLFRLAVASPGYNQMRGLVQVWDLDLDFINGGEGGLNSALIPYENLVGSTNGDQFGESLAMRNRSENPLLVVGSPGSNGKTGKVSVFQSNEIDQSWITLAAISGSAMGEAFGTALASTPDASLVAVSTASGRVTLYEQYLSFEMETAYEETEHLENTTNIGQPFPHLTISLNEAGSLLFVGAPGRAVSFLDQSPFCGISSYESINDAFLGRHICRKDANEDASLHDCTTQVEYVNGTPYSCVWYSREAATSWPSDAPSMAPTIGVSGGVASNSSTVPSTSPSLSTSSPTASTPGNQEPSLAPSTTPSLSRTEHPTVAPTLDPTYSVHPTVMLPTAPPSTNNGESDDSGLTIRRCDDIGVLNDPLSSSSPLQLCLTYPGERLRISQMAVEQGSSRVVLLDEAEANDVLAAQGLLHTSVTVERDESDCRVSISNIPTFLFGPERPSEMNITGWVAVMNPVASLFSSGHLRRRQLALTSPLHFSITITLKLNDESAIGSLQDDSGEQEKDKDTKGLSWPFILLWFGLALLVLFISWRYLRCLISKDSGGIE